MQALGLPSLGNDKAEEGTGVLMQHASHLHEICIKLLELDLPLLC